MNSETRVAVHIEAFSERKVTLYHRDVVSGVSRPYGLSAATIYHGASDRIVFLWRTRWDPLL